MENSDSDEDQQNVAFIRDPADGHISDDGITPPPMLWEARKAKVNRGPTVRKSTGVPKPATYEEPNIKLSMQSV